MSRPGAEVIRIPEIPDSEHFPSFSAPEILGCFSLDSSRHYIEGPEFLKFCPDIPGKRQVRFDLNENCAEVSLEQDNINQKETNELVQLLRWIHAHQDTFESRRPNFVFYRGLMSKILNTPYEDKDGWTIGALYKNGTIYLRNIETPESLRNRDDYYANPRLKRISAWGFHFEDFVLTDEPHGRPNPTAPQKNECNVVYQSKLKDHRILYAAELDGVWVRDGNDLNPKIHPELLSQCQLVELKTTRFFPKGQMTYNFKRFNLRKWWCQSFPAKISDIVVGFRDDEGVVHELEVMPVKSLPRMGADWSATVCFNFMDQFLTEVKKTVKCDADAVYVFEFLPRNQRGRSRDIFVYRELNSDNSLPNLL